jgi:hypothetical protein
MFQPFCCEKACGGCGRKKQPPGLKPLCCGKFRGAEAPLFHVALRMSIVPEIKGYGEGRPDHAAEMIS